MSNIIKKKQKSVFSRIIKLITGKPTKDNYDLINPAVTLCDNSLNSDDMNIIENRRNELRRTQHDNANVEVLSE